MDYLQNVMGYFDQQQPLCAQHDKISKDLYQEYGVKAGLRDENGKGVLAGLTNIVLDFLLVGVLRGGIVAHNRGWAAAPSEAGRSALAVAFVFGPSGQDCGGIHGGKLL